MKWDVIIVGAGAAGLMAAATLKNKKVLVLEKTSKAGKKVLLSGAGQCNVTHGGDMTGFESCYGKQWRFVREALSLFTNEDTINFMNKSGVETITLESGKVFPKSLLASDVVDALVNRFSVECRMNLNEAVESIVKEEHWCVKTRKDVYYSDNVIVATGGITYNNTGSTGDGFAIAKKLGVKLEEPRYALAPVYISCHDLQTLSGLSFKDLSISVYREKKVGDFKGDLLITHFGYSGPVILNHSRYFRKGDSLKINFTKYETKKALEDAFLKICQTSPKKNVKNLIQADLLTNSLVDRMFELLKIDTEVKAAELKKNDRKNILNFMFEFTCLIKHVGKEHISMVTAGGISTKVISPKTYEVKKQPGLYFIGECVDVDGDTGGYNIQFAFSSAVSAAKHIMGNKHD